MVVAWRAAGFLLPVYCEPGKSAPDGLRRENGLAGDDASAHRADQGAGREAAGSSLSRSGAGKRRCISWLTDAGEEPAARDGGEWYSRGFWNSTCYFEGMDMDGWHQFSRVPCGSATDNTEVLQVLAIHPDYLLRQEVLYMLRDRWLALSPVGWSNVVTGLIRECQYEMALETLWRMKSQNIHVPEWLLQLLIYNLCECEEFGCVLDLMQDHVKQGGQLSPTLWYHVLDTASNALHEECSSFVWKGRVEIGLLNPPRGVCNNMLTMTSRTGNTQLATSVFQFLLSGKHAITDDDYEALIDTYVVNGSIYSAFMVLCMMTGATVNQGNTSTRSILSHLIATDQDPRSTWQTLRELSHKVKEAPISAANVILELCVHQGKLDVALELYKDINTFIPKGPNTSTFNCLIHGSRKANKLDYASFFVQEMIESRILPNRATYEELVLLCVEGGHFKSANDYLHEMNASGFAMTETGATRLRSLCNDSSDRHAQEIMANVDTLAKRPAERRHRKRR